VKHSLLCSPFAERLEAWHDGELEIDEQIGIESHVAGCAACSATVRELRQLRSRLHSEFDDRVSGLDAAFERMAQSVVTRARAERHETLPARIARMFEDLHLVWAGLAGSTATAACVAVMAAVLHFAPPERADSLAVILSEPGTNRNPVRMDYRTALPRVDEQNVMHAMLVDSPDAPASVWQTLTLSGVVTLEGRLSRASLVEVGGYEGREARRLMNAVAGARFQPAQRGGSPVAVNLIWLLERTTVRGKISG
jgi:Putative zinc-finger